MGCREWGMLIGGRGYEIFFKWRGRFRNDGGTIPFTNIDTYFFV